MPEQSLEDDVFDLLHKHGWQELTDEVLEFLRKKGLSDDD